METVETKKVQAGCAGVPVCAQVDSAHLRGETQLGNTTLGARHSRGHAQISLSAINKILAAQR